MTIAISSNAVSLCKCAEKLKSSHNNRPAKNEVSVNIEIRRVEPSDARAVKEIYECRSVYSGMLQLPFPSVDMWQKKYGNIPDHVHAFVAIIQGEVVGNIGLMVETNPRRRHAATFGMAVKERFQGQGVGSALLAAVIDLADNWLNLKRIEITVYVDNAPAIKLYEKFGFVVEGESKAFAFRNGDWVSAYHMARVVMPFSTSMN